MAVLHGIAKSPPVNEGELSSFIGTLSSLSPDQWKERVVALRLLVESIPDYSTTPSASDNNDDIIQNGGGGTVIPWYRSSKSVRRLSHPLKTLLLDARSAVVKEVTELIGILMTVKLQSHPSLTITMGDNNNHNQADNSAKQNNGGLETINGNNNMVRSQQQQQPPPPPFVGRLLFKDLLPAILDLSKQTVKLIRSYGVSMTIDILPHCRVKSSIIILLEKMKTHVNRTVREDCARYVRCILETWPWDKSGSSNIDNSIIIINDDNNNNVHVTNSRKEERLSLDSCRQIGLGLGRTLSDSAKPVREEVKRGFQVLYTRFRPIWDEVMSSGVVRDVRLRKKLLDAASRSASSGEGGHTNNNLFDDLQSLGEMSLNSAVSGLSYASYRSTTSHRSYASRCMTNGGVPSMIGTPKVSPRMRSRTGHSPSGGSPSYMRGTGASSSRTGEQSKMQAAKEASHKYSANEYVTSSGHKLSTPSPRRGRGATATTTTEQPFASLLQTPNRTMTPDSKQKTRNTLRNRLSRRISGIKQNEIHEHITSPSQLTSIDETQDSHHEAAPSSSAAVESDVDFIGIVEESDPHSAEITNVALEVISAHIAHLNEMEKLITKEKDLLLDLNTKLGVTITDKMKAIELKDRLATLTEEQVCDYFESVHVCADKQRVASEELLGEMERISTGDSSTVVSGIESPSSLQHNRQDLAQSPFGDGEPSLQRNLRDEF